MKYEKKSWGVAQPTGSFLGEQDEDGFALGVAQQGTRFLGECDGQLPDYTKKHSEEALTVALGGHAITRSILQRTKKKWKRSTRSAGCWRRRTGNEKEDIEELPICEQTRQYVRWSRDDPDCAETSAASSWFHLHVVDCRQWLMGFFSRQGDVQVLRFVGMGRSQTHMAHSVDPACLNLPFFEPECLPYSPPRRFMVPRRVYHL